MSVTAAHERLKAAFEAMLIENILFCIFGKGGSPANYCTFLFKEGKFTGLGLQWWLGKLIWNGLGPDGLSILLIDGAWLL